MNQVTRGGPGRPACIPGLYQWVSRSAVAVILWMVLVSVLVVVGLVRCSVSEMMPAQRQMAVALSGAAPRMRYMMPTIVQLLPTGSLMKRIGSLVRRLPLRR